MHHHRRRVYAVILSVHSCLAGPNWGKLRGQDGAEVLPAVRVLFSYLYCVLFSPLWRHDFRYSPISMFPFSVWDTIWDTEILILVVFIGSPEKLEILLRAETQPNSCITNYTPTR